MFSAHETTWSPASASWRVSRAPASQRGRLLRRSR